MDKLIIEQGVKTPRIEFDPSGFMKITGRSVPENAIEFYDPIHEWINKLSVYPEAGFKLIVQLEYFNTSSSKCLLDLFRRLESIHLQGTCSVSISWLYDEGDEDMLESGEDYQQIVKIPFTFGKAD